MILRIVMCCVLAILVAGVQSEGTKRLPAGASTGNVQISIQTRQSNTSTIPIAAKAGDQFVVTLESNVTTGYKWQLAEKPNSKIVAFVKSVYNAPSQSIPGRGGTESWTFKAVGKGSTTITLQYVRPWEKGVAPVRVQKFQITIL